MYHFKQTKSIPDSKVYERVGMALISAQRVEQLTGDLLKHLEEFDKTVYGITSTEFWEKSKKSNKARKTLGQVFNLLKLNPKWVIEEELEAYLEKRNLLAHGFWRVFLNGRNEGQSQRALDFCNSFGEESMRMERFFKGFIFFLALRHVADREKVPLDLIEWQKDFDFFVETLNEERWKRSKPDYEVGDPT